MEKRTIHIIPYTHADHAWGHSRDWHEHRYVLILNEVLDNIKKTGLTFVIDNYNHFVEPFVRHCPQRLGELKDAIKNKRICVAGAVSSLARPTQIPDETLVRNFITGRQKFEALGLEETLTYANVDTAIGNSQLPQILRLAGYKYYWAWRPQAYLDCQGYKRDFFFQGQDGSKILTGVHFYGSFGFINDYINEDIYTDFDKVEQKFRERELKNTAPHTDLPHIWLTHGMDDVRPLLDRYDEKTLIPEFIEEFNKHGGDMKFSTPDAYFSAVEKENLPVYSGVIDPVDVCYNMPSKGTYGLYYLRAELDKALVEAEKLCVFASLYGFKYDDALFRELWLTCVSISGHAMDFVFEQDEKTLHESALSALTRANALIKSACGHIAAMTAGKRNEKVLLNLSSHDREENAELSFPFADKTQDFYLADESGMRLESQVVKIVNGSGVYSKQLYDELNMLVKINIPAFSMKKISIIEKDEEKPFVELCSPLTNAIDRLIDGGKRQAVDTGAIKVTFNAGKIESVTKGGSVLYDGKGPFGDLVFTRTFHEPDSSWFITNQQIGEDAFAVHSYSFVEYGPLRYVYEVKGSIGENETVQRIILEKDSSEINFRASITAGQPDTGYFRVVFGADSDPEITGDIPFGTEPKNIDKEVYQIDNSYVYEGYERRVKGVFVSRSFVRFNAESCKMSLVSKSNSRYFCYDDAENTISLILNKRIDKRKSKCLVMHMSDAIMTPSPSEYCYSAVMSDSIDDAAAASHCHASPLRSASKLWDFGEAGLKRLLEIPDGIRVSAFYRESGKYYLRIYDYLGKEREVKIPVGFSVSGAKACDFLKNPIEPIIGFKGNILSFNVKPYKIITVEITRGDET